MILMLVPLVALVLGAMCGGRPDALLQLPLRRLWLVPLAFGIQWVLVRVPTLEPHPVLGVALVISYSALILFLGINRRVPGLALALVGALLNLTAIAANGGFMPTTPATLAAAGLERSQMVLGQRVAGSKDILLPPGGAVFGPLGDTMVLLWPIPQAFSLGDVLVAVGIGALVFLGMQPRWRRTGNDAGPGAHPHPPGQGRAAEAQPARDLKSASHPVRR